MENKITKIMTIWYYAGEKNEEYWELLDDIKHEAKFKSSRWDGDYYVSEYETEDKIYVQWENMELGIQSKIEIYKK